MEVYYFITEKRAVHYFLSGMALFYIVV